MAEVVDEYDSESAILEDWCNAFDSEPDGPYIDELFADDNWINEYSRGAQKAKQRNQA